MREQMLRTRMRQANGTSFKVLAREEIDEIREVEYSNQPVSGSPLLKLPLLQRGTLLVERLNEAMTDGAVQHRRWGLMRVCTEVGHRDRVTTRSKVLATAGVWNDSAGGYLFVETRDSRTDAVFGDFYFCYPGAHRSGLLVVELEYELEHAEEGELVKLSELQIQELDRIARMDAARPDSQFEWWESVREESSTTGAQSSTQRAGADIRSTDRPATIEEPDGEIAEVSATARRHAARAYASALRASSPDETRGGSSR